MAVVSSCFDVSDSVLLMSATLIGANFIYLFILCFVLSISSISLIFFLFYFIYSMLFLVVGLKSSPYGLC